MEISVDEENFLSICQSLFCLFFNFFSFGWHAKLFESSKMQLRFAVQNWHIVKAMLSKANKIRVKLVYL